MTMNEPLTLVLAGMAGCFLGTLFFGGLWWTVRKGVSSKRPALWFVGSLLLRTGMLLAGFCFFSGGHWERLVACLVGFVIARFMVTWLTRPPVEHQNSQTRESSHAPQSR
jgi:F1F0 ATPase subunit 2